MKDRPAATNLGLMMKRYRIVGEHNMRDLGRSVGVSAATWMRMEHGYMPNAANLVKLLAWMLREIA